MPFDDIQGQVTAIETLSRALRHDLVHHAYRFEGIAGVGKERTAMAFVQALLCPVEPLGCGRCETCRRCVTFTEGTPSVPIHPDVVLIGRGVYPAETIGGKKETSEISVEQIRRVVLARVQYPPHEARAQVFIVRNAEQLSISAANALLKTLEEPRPATHFVLLTAQPERLLDTIRSRTMPVRFGPLSEEVLLGLLEARGVEKQAALDAVAIAGGSAAVALDAVAEGGADRNAFVEAVLAAMKSPHLDAGVRFGEGLKRDRQEVTVDLMALSAYVVRRSREAVVKGDQARAEGWARRHALVLDAIDAIQRNGAINVVVAGLVASLRQGRQARPGHKPPIVVQRR